MTDHDPVNHPSHYTSSASGVECITVTETFNFNMGNAIKYIWRTDEKGSPLENLRKAAWYIEREIARREKLLPSGPMKSSVEIPLWMVGAELPLTDVKFGPGIMRIFDGPAVPTKATPFDPDTGLSTQEDLPKADEDSAYVGPNGRGNASGINPLIAQGGSPKHNLPTYDPSDVLHQDSAVAVNDGSVCPWCRSVEFYRMSSISGQQACKCANDRCRDTRTNNARLHPVQTPLEADDAEPSE